MTDSEMREVVNQLRDIAKDYGTTQQLRERIAGYIVPILRALHMEAASFKQVGSYQDGQLLYSKVVTK